MLEIEKLKVAVEEREILSGFDLAVGSGEVHAIMGPNGAGKSTLAKALGGHPGYELLGGSVRLDGAELLELDPEERARLGLFVSFQYPVEIPGVSNFDFLMAAHKAHRKARGEEPLSEEAFRALVAEKMELLEVPSHFLERNVNEGFSGGEKKKNEILQMALLEPKVAILDETDSGLDIDALRDVARGVNQFMAEGGRAVVLITHYQRLLDTIRPDRVHVMIDGRLVRSGGPELALLLEERGYDWLSEPAASGAK